MTGAEIAQIIIAAATFVTALGGVLIGLRNTRRIDDVHKIADGLSTQAQNAAEGKGRAQGEIAGRAFAKAEQGSDALAREQGKPPVSPVI